MADAEEEALSPGWDAINRALEPIYHGREPRHYGTLLSYRLGGGDPLDGISAYPRDDPFPYWHFVTFGFTDLYGPEKGGEGVNGFGFELTMRLRRPADQVEPPMWAISFLQNLARYVFKTGNVFESGHFMNCNGPIALDEKTALCAVLFTKDPELGPIEAAHGAAEFLQVVGITADEEDAVQAWNSDGVLGLLREREPLLCTDLARSSILTDAVVVETVRAGMVRDGSKTATLFVSNLQWRAESRLFGPNTVTLTIAAGQAGRLALLLRGRLGHGRNLGLVGSERQVEFQPGDKCGFGPSGARLSVRLTPAAIDELVLHLQPKAGLVELKHFPGFRLEIQPTQITDRDGKVIRTIG